MKRIPNPGEMQALFTKAEVRMTGHTKSDGQHFSPDCFFLNTNPPTPPISAGPECCGGLWTCSFPQFLTEGWLLQSETAQQARQSYSQFSSLVISFPQAAASPSPLPYLCTSPATAPILQSICLLLGFSKSERLGVTHWFRSESTTEVIL